MMLMSQSLSVMYLLLLLGCAMAFEVIQVDVNSMSMNCDALKKASLNSDLSYCTHYCSEHYASILKIDQSAEYCNIGCDLLYSGGSEFCECGCKTMNGYQETQACLLGCNFFTINNIDIASIPTNVPDVPTTVIATTGDSFAIPDGQCYDHMREALKLFSSLWGLEMSCGMAASQGGCELDDVKMLCPVSCSICVPSVTQFPSTTTSDLFTSHEIASTAKSTSKVSVPPETSTTASKTTNDPTASPSATSSDSSVTLSSTSVSDTESTSSSSSTTRTTTKPRVIGGNEVTPSTSVWSSTNIAVVSIAIVVFVVAVVLVVLIIYRRRRAAPRVHAYDVTSNASPTPKTTRMAFVERVQGSDHNVVLKVFQQRTPGPEGFDDFDVEPDFACVKSLEGTKTLY